MRVNKKKLILTGLPLQMLCITCSSSGLSVWPGVPLHSTVKLTRYNGKYSVLLIFDVALIGGYMMLISELVLAT